MRRVALLLALAVAGCDAPAGKSGDAAPQAVAVSSEGAAVQPAVAASGAAEVSEATEDYEFNYSWPAEVSAHPALARSLAAERDAALARLKQDTRGERAAAMADGYEFRPHGFHVRWLRAADLPRWLSLSAETSTYTGGAHPNGGFDSLIWDKQARRRLPPLDLFQSAGAFDAAVREPFCARLDAERAERRGAPVNRASGDQFDACITPSEQTVLLGSSNARTFDRMTILVAPYAAGPYAEGTYEIDLPVTAAVLDAVKPELRAEFSAR